MTLFLIKWQIACGVRRLPEKRPVGRHSRQEQGIRAILAFAMAYLRGRYNGGAFYKNSNQRNDVRHYRPGSFVAFSASWTGSNRLYNERVYRLHRY